MGLKCQINIFAEIYVFLLFIPLNALLIWNQCLSTAGICLYSDIISTTRNVDLTDFLHSKWDVLLNDFKNFISKMFFFCTRRELAAIRAAPVLCLLSSVQSPPSSEILFSRKINAIKYVYLYLFSEEKKLLLLSALVERFGVSRMQDFWSYFCIVWLTSNSEEIFKRLQMWLNNTQCGQKEGKKFPIFWWDNHQGESSHILFQKKLQMYKQPVLQLHQPAK